MVRNSKEKQLLGKLKGLTVAAATPMNQQGTVDQKSLTGLIRHLADNGAAAVLAQGWMGEQPLLSDEERKEIYRIITESAAGKLPVICGVSEQSLRRAVQLVRAAEEAGADAVLATPCYSYPMSQKSHVEYFAALAADSGLPLIVYNNGETGTNITPDSAQKLKETPGIIGIKDTSSFPQVQTLLMSVHDPDSFIIQSGDEYLFGPALFIGATSATMGGPGNVITKHCVSMMEDAEKGDWDNVSDKHRRLIQFCDTLYGTAENPYVTVKTALSILGFGSGTAAPPLPNLTGSQRNEVERVLKRFEDLL